MQKISLNISLDRDLADFIKIFAQKNQTTTSELITQLILTLKRRTQIDSTDIIFSDQNFYQAIKDVQSRLRSGTANGIHLMKYSVNDGCKI